MGAPIDLREGDVQALESPDNSFDIAAATSVFCSVPDPIRGLLELNRVVKPGGKILLLEHASIDRPILGRPMNLLNPHVVRVYGANINRRTVENVAREGWTSRASNTSASANAFLGRDHQRFSPPLQPCLR